MGRTAFHMAAYFSKQEVLQEILNWAKENLTTEEINKLLLATGSKGRTVFHASAMGYNQEILQEILEGSKKPNIRYSK